MKNKEYEKWLKNAPLKVKKIISQYDEQKVQEAFEQELAFGTAGIRGIMGYGSAFFNEFTIIKATFGYAKFLIKNKNNPKIVICTDNRRNNKKFMNQAIAVLNSFGIKTFFSKVQPTPFVSFVTRSLKLDGAIIITASHNPKEYNGIKFYDEKGCQILPSINNEVMEEASKLGDNIFTKEFKIKKSLNKKIPKTEFTKYIEIVSSIFKEKKENDLRIVFGASNGTSGKIMNGVFKKININLINITKQLKPNANFKNTPYPNPEMHQAFELGFKKGYEKKADAIFLVDPDADRFALAILHKNKYQIISGNEIGIIILYDILAQNKNKNGYFIYSNVSTTMSEILAKYFKIQSYKTLTGFKWIGDLIEKMDQNNFLFGFEESNGCLINPQLARDKDSFQAAVYISNILLRLKKQKETMVDFLEIIKKKLGYFESLTETFNIDSTLDTYKFLENIQNKAKKLNLKYKNYLKEKKPNMKALLLEIFIDDYNTILIRPSGTEPKMKIYSHYYGKTRVVFNENKSKIKKIILQFFKNYK